MQRSTQTSPFLKHRAEKVAPENVEKMKAAIKSKDFPVFAEITMKVSIASSSLSSLYSGCYSNSMLSVVTLSNKSIYMYIDSVPALIVKMLQQGKEGLGWCRKRILLY